MAKLLCEKNLRDVWCRNESVRAEIGQILHTHTHTAKLVVEMEQRTEQREGLIGRKLCWRQVMRVSWMERQTEVWVLENMKPGWTLESRMAQTDLRFLDMW